MLFRSIPSSAVQNEEELANRTHQPPANTEELHEQHSNIEETRVPCNVGGEDKDNTCVQEFQQKKVEIAQPVQPAASTLMTNECQQVPCIVGGEDKQNTLVQEFHQKKTEIPQLVQPATSTEMTIKCQLQDNKVRDDMINGEQSNYYPPSSSGAVRIRGTQSTDLHAQPCQSNQTTRGTCTQIGDDNREDGDSINVMSTNTRQQFLECVRWSPPRRPPAFDIPKLETPMVMEFDEGRQPKVMFHA